jgi:hypothetical protein
MEEIQDIDFLYNNNTINWALDFAHKFTSWAYKHLIKDFTSAYIHYTLHHWREHHNHGQNAKPV